MKLLVLFLASLFAEANQQYINGNYAESAAIYEQCLNAASSDSVLTADSKAQIYYNLGNAYFKDGELSKSILCYERSLRLNPSDEDTQFNLEFARTKIVDDIPDNQAFFFASWAKNVRNGASESTWLFLSVVLFVVMLVGAVLFALGRTSVVRKAAFHTAWVSLLFSVYFGLNASSLHSRDSLRAEAIVTQGVLTAKSSPDKSGTDLFTLHEGTKVEIKETLGEWCNIHVGNNEGWILLRHIERI